MDELALLIVILIIVGLLLAAVVVPIVALVVAIQSRRRLNQHLSRLIPETPQQTGELDLPRLAQSVHKLEARTERIESHLGITSSPIPKTEPREPEVEQRPQPQVTEPVVEATQPPTVTHQPIPAVPHAAPLQAADIESIIGRRWLGWIAIALILFAASFFLKYAFDNRWIGELGRVAIGVVAGLSFTLLGYRYYRRNWRVFSQVLTAGGIVLLYLSVYAAFGYYHLVTQRAAFIYLVIVIAEAAALAVLYDARAIAIMALIGGFLTPMLLRSDRDQYQALFGYITALNLGAQVLPRHWNGLRSVAFAGTHLLFWLWYADNYHPQKLAAVMTFQTGVFLIFLFAPLGQKIFKRQSATVEDLYLLPLNAFVFFATAYNLLSPHYQDWMGAFAIVMALVYAGVAKVLLDRSATTRIEVLIIIGVALTFVTLAIPIQLQGNWITIGWSVLAVTMLWAGIKTKSLSLEASALALFALALGKLVFWDTPFYRALFTPVLNRYFLSSLAVIATLFVAAGLYQKLPRSINLKLPLLLFATITLWLVMSVETFTYFQAQAYMKEADDVRHQLWLGQMALSVLWSIYAGTLAFIGFVRQSAAIRWLALGFFGLTVVKVMLVDLAQLRQLYRIIAFLVLGLLLLIVAWGYNKAFRNKESSK